MRIVLLLALLAPTFASAETDYEKAMRWLNSEDERAFQIELAHAKRDCDKDANYCFKYRLLLAQAKRRLEWAEQRSLQGEDR